MLEDVLVETTEGASQKIEAEYAEGCAQKLFGLMLTVKEVEVAKEGAFQQKTTIIEKCVLQNYIYDNSKVIDEGEIEEGLLVYSVQSTPASGEFSVVTTPAWKIEKDKVIHATKGAMLAGNVFSTLKNISALANNERKVWQLVAPWVLMENVKVIGK